MDLKSTYNKIARDWETDHNKDTWWIDGTNKYLSFFSPNASILDVGCGAGEKSKFLIRKGLKVTGIDFSEEMIKMAKEQVPQGKFFLKDIKKSLNIKNKFDGIFAQAVLLHISKKEIQKVIKNIIEPLKSGGYLYIAVKEIKSGGDEEEISKENNYGYEYERFFSYFTLEELKKILTNLNLKVVYDNTATFGKTNWIKIVAKKL